MLGPGPGSGKWRLFRQEAAPHFCSDPSPTYAQPVGCPLSSVAFSIPGAPGECVSQAWGTPWSIPKLFLPSPEAHSWSVSSNPLFLGVWSIHGSCMGHLGCRPSEPAAALGLAMSDREAAAGVPSRGVPFAVGNWPRLMWQNLKALGWAPTTVLFGAVLHTQQTHAQVGT